MELARDFVLVATVGWAAFVIARHGFRLAFRVEEQQTVRASDGTALAHVVVSRWRWQKQRVVHQVTIGNGVIMTPSGPIKVGPARMTVGNVSE